MNDSRLKQRGHWPFKQTWYSICSKHFAYDLTCDMCNAGSWDYDVSVRISQWFHKYFYKLWYIWVNRLGNPTLKRLQKWFPNLR